MPHDVQKALTLAKLRFGWKVQAFVRAPTVTLQRDPKLFRLHWGMCRVCAPPCSSPPPLPQVFRIAMPSDQDDLISSKRMSSRGTIRVSYSHDTNEPGLSTASMVRGCRDPSNGAPSMLFLVRVLGPILNRPELPSTVVSPVWILRSVPNKYSR